MAASNLDVQLLPRKCVLPQLASAVSYPASVQATLIGDLACSRDSSALLRAKLIEAGLLLVSQ